MPPFAVTPGASFVDRLLDLRPELWRVTVAKHRHCVLHCLVDELFFRLGANRDGAIGFAWKITTVDVLTHFGLLGGKSAPPATGARTVIRTPVPGRRQGLRYPGRINGQVRATSPPFLRADRLAGDLEPLDRIEAARVTRRAFGESGQRLRQESRRCRELISGRGAEAQLVAGELNRLHGAFGCDVNRLYQATHRGRGYSDGWRWPRRLAASIQSIITHPLEVARLVKTEFRVL